MFFFRTPGPYFLGGILFLFRYPIFSSSKCFLRNSIFWGDDLGGPPEGVRHRRDPPRAGSAAKSRRQSIIEPCPTQSHIVAHVCMYLCNARGKLTNGQPKRTWKTFGGPPGGPPAMLHPESLGDANMQRYLARVRTYSESHRCTRMYILM